MNRDGLPGYNRFCRSVKFHIRRGCPYVRNLTGQKTALRRWVSRVSRGILISKRVGACVRVIFQLDGPNGTLIEEETTTATTHTIERPEDDLSTFDVDGAWVVDEDE